MNWLQLGGSLVAVLALAGIAWALKLGRDGGIGSSKDAERAAEAALAGFVAMGAIVGEDAVLVASRDGRLAVLKRHGAHVAVREVARDVVRQDRDAIIVETGERLFGRVSIVGVDGDALVLLLSNPPLQGGGGSPKD